MTKEYTYRELIEAQLRGEQVQILNHSGDTWIDREHIINCSVIALDEVHDGYRIKPKMRRVRICNGIELPQSEYEPLSEGTPYYYPHLDMYCGVEYGMWKNSYTDFSLLKKGMVYLSRDDAQAHHNAIVNVVIKEIEE